MIYEQRHAPLLPVSPFIKRASLHLLISVFIIAISLGIGIVGYEHYGQMGFVDAYENAAMILSGMGPVADMPTAGGKIFAGSYALFSGIVFLIAIAIIAAPLIHRFLHAFLLKDIK